MDAIKRMDRREALKWMLSATATVSLLNARSFGVAAPAKGYGSDPDLMQSYRPGDLWPLSFSTEQHRAVAALCDLIIPADEQSPSASQLRVPDFIDEWVSAPYPQQQEDRRLIMTGLDWLEAESKKRFSAGFASLSSEQQHQICDEICYLPKAKPAFEEAARFFAKFRNLTVSGFYTTPEGMKDIQYLGNVPLMKFDGPPPEVLRHLGV